MRDPRTPLVIDREWPLPADNPKTPVLRRRREKALATRRKYADELDMLERLFAGRRRVLDVACGTGFRVLELANRGYEPVGLEIDPNLCELANLAAHRFALPARQVCGDACSLPFADGSFDVVMSHSFFEHVYDVNLALAEQIRLLRVGGLLIIQDGNLLNPSLAFDLLVRYPLRTRGRHGGVKWLFTKRRVHSNLYGYLPLGRDEDVKTLWWWRRKLRATPGVRPVEVATTRKFIVGTLPGFMYPFGGMCLAVAEKV